MSEKNADENPMSVIATIQAKMYFFMGTESIKDNVTICLYYGVASNNTKARLR